MHGDPGGDRALTAHRLSHRRQGLQPEPAPVRQAAPVAVGPPVSVRRQELGHQVAVCPVHVDDVEADVGGPPCGVDPAPLDAGDVSGIHLLGEPTPLNPPGCAGPGPRGTPRGPLWGRDPPPGKRPTPASDPCAWIASAASPSARASRSSQISAATGGVSSESCEIGAYSTHTPPQPPSALTARNAACVLGLAEPNPDACGTW